MPKGPLTGVLLLALALGISLLAPIPPSFRPSASRGLDTGFKPKDRVDFYEDLASAGLRGGWIRLRQVDLQDVAGSRQGLANIRRLGLRACAYIRWKHPGRGPHYLLPADLRDAYTYGRQLGEAYGDLVDAWEMDNEPDIGFVPEPVERFAAYQKALYLGLKAGIRECLSLKPPPARTPLVLMASLSLPPGPWLERFADNDGLSYTDGYNYHYYGYAGDFTGVYRQHEAAFHELANKSLDRFANHPTATVPARGSHQRSSPLQALGFSPRGSDGRSARPASPPPPPPRSYPVFLTEIGYGHLGQKARESKEGRIRQWRWFDSVAGQVDALKIEGPMGFYLPPNLDNGKEFGLTISPAPGTGRTDREPEPATRIAGGIAYSPADFAPATKAGPQLFPVDGAWTRLIGRQIAGNEISPALARWLAPASAWQRSLYAQPAPARSWVQPLPPASPIVIDFLPGEGLRHVKRYNAHFVVGPAATVAATAKAASAPVKPQEEFLLTIRTRNGNTYGVYPILPATPDWQSMLERKANFTMWYYSRSALPWRLADNQPLAMNLALFPKKLPAIYEFRHPSLIRITPSPHPTPARLAGSGRVILYNFSDQAVSGHLAMPGVMRLPASDAASGRTDAGQSPGLTLQPGERREFAVTIQLPEGRYESVPAEFTFLAAPGSGAGAARLKTEFISNFTGSRSELLGSLLGPAPFNTPETFRQARAVDEAPMHATALPTPWAALVQAGARVEPTQDGFRVVVTAMPPGKESRVEIEIPWPDNLGFPEDAFLSLGYRLGD